MKTLAFGTFDLMPLEDGDMLLNAYSPSHGHFEMVFTADELMMLQVEIGNGLAVARDIQLEKRKKDDLLKEQRR